MKKKDAFLLTLVFIVALGLVFFGCGNPADGEGPPSPIVLKALGNGAIVYNMTFSGDSGVRSARAAGIPDGYDSVIWMILPNGKKQQFNGNINGYVLNTGANGRSFQIELFDSAGVSVGLFDLTTENGELSIVDFNNTITVDGETAGNISGPLIPINKTSGFEGSWMCEDQKDPGSNVGLMTVIINGGTMTSVNVGQAPYSSNIGNTLDNLEIFYGSFEDNIFTIDHKVQWDWDDPTPCWKEILMDLKTFELTLVDPNTLMSSGKNIDDSYQHQDLVWTRMATE